jgi:5-methylthioadenosine/S-adenosylhomocysteine deaminase
VEGGQEKNALSLFSAERPNNMAILFEHASVVTLENRKLVLEGQQLIIENGVIAEMGKRCNLERFTITKKIDCSGKVLMPGLVNTHSHLTEILQRGFRDNVRMEVWRGYRAVTEEKANLTSEEIGAAVALACAEMLKNGVTAVVDHFSTRPGLSVRKMQAVLGGFEKTGIRGVLAASLRDQDFLRLIHSPRIRKGPLRDRREEPWRDQVLTVLEEIKKSSKITTLMLGPSSPLNCSDSLLRRVVEMAEERDMGVHTHLLETKLQKWAARKLYGMTICDHLSRLGFLSPRLSAAHCVWIENKEMDLMASSGASAVHNPASNLKLGSGIAPVIELKKHGVNVALGTDGGDTSDSYSIFEQMRLAAYLSRLTAENPDHWVTASDALRMGTVNGAQAVPAWRGAIGRIKVGYRADLLILKPDLRLHPLNDVIHQLVFCEAGHSVDTVLVDGVIVVEGGRLMRVNEEALIQKVGSISKKMYHIYRVLKNRPNHESAIQRLYKQAYGRNQQLRSFPR